MSWQGVAAGLVTTAVGAGLVALAVGDVRSGLVPVRWSKTLTAVALGGLGTLGLLTGAWSELIQATAGALMVTGVQLVPYLVAARTGREWVGRADVRLGLPMGWTLGWFGFGFALVGFATALVAGLVWSAVARRRRVPFVPCLAIGFWLAVLWAAAVATGAGR